MTGLPLPQGPQRSRPRPGQQFIGGTQGLQLCGDIQLQGCGDPARLGDHEHRLRQPLQVRRLKGLQLLDPDPQPVGQDGDRQAPGLAGLAQAPPQGRQAGAMTTLAFASASG